MPSVALDPVLPICWASMTIRHVPGGSGMNKYSCTKSICEEIYYATLIAETSQLAKQMAINEINQKWMVGKRRLAERLECQGSRNQCRWPGPHHRMRLPRGVNSALIAAQPRSSLFVEPWTTFSDRVFS
jgi:hypothetical protein